MVATAVRQGEARKAIWDEIDLSDPDNPKWTIHYTRMKMRHEHIVPLSNQAVAVLKLVRPLSGGSGYVFPSEYSKYGHLSDSTLGVVNAANGIDCNVHGFRSSFRDWAEETTRYSRLAMELSLAHSVGDSTEQSYRRTTVVEQRQKLMQEWADFALGNCVDVLDQQGANATIFNASLA